MSWCSSRLVASIWPASCSASACTCGGGVESGRAYAQACHALALPAVYPFSAYYLPPQCLRPPAAGRRGGRGARVAEQRAAQQQHLGARLEAESGSVSV